jgi:hypothetical protein
MYRVKRVILIKTIRVSTDGTKSQHLGADTCLGVIQRSVPDTPAILPLGR